MKLVDLPRDVIILIAEHLSPVDALRLFKTCNLFFTYYNQNYNEQYAAVIMDSLTKGNQRKSIKSLKYKQNKMIQSLINEPVKTVNLFNCDLLEEPSFKIIENGKAAFSLWQNQIVHEYSDFDSDFENRYLNFFTLLNEVEYNDLFLLDFAPVGLLKFSSVENTITDTTIIEHDRHPDDECVVQIIPLCSPVCKNQSNIYFQQDTKSILKSKKLVNNLCTKYPQTSAIINKPLHQFNWENVISTEVKDSSRTSNWILPVNFSEQLYLNIPKNFDKKFYDPILFNLLYKRRKRKTMRDCAIRRSNLFTPEKFLKINDITSGKYLISIDHQGDNSGKYMPIVIKCYKKTSIADVHVSHDQLQSSMVWKATIQLRYNIEENLNLLIFDSLSIPTFLKIQISDFYTLVPVRVHSFNVYDIQTVDIYYWLVFKTPNGEYMGKYKINYDQRVSEYRIRTFRMSWYERHQMNTHLLTPQIIMIGSNLFKIHYNWKILDDEFFNNVCRIDDFQLLWTSVINFLNMIDNNIDNDQHLKVDVDTSRYITSNKIDSNGYDGNNHDHCAWKAIVETPTIDILQSIINIKYPNFDIIEMTVDPYFWNNNNVAIKVQFYLEAIFDPNIQILDRKSFKYLMLYDIEAKKWKFISLNNPLVDYNPKYFQTLIIDNKLNLIVLGKDSISVPIYS